jgi:hypothetical protein
MKGLIHLPVGISSHDSDTPAFLEADLRTSKFHVAYEILDDQISFNVTRFDGSVFHKPVYAVDVLERELEVIFSRLIEFLES